MLPVSSYRVPITQEAVGSSPVAPAVLIYIFALKRDCGSCLVLAKLLCLSAIIRYPCHCSGRGGQSQSANRKHGNVINFPQRDSSLARVSDCRMCSAFQTRSNRQGEFDQPSALFIQRASVVTALSQFIECFPYLRMALAELVYCFRQLLRHAGYLPPRLLTL